MTFDAVIQGFADPSFEISIRDALRRFLNAEKFRYNDVELGPSPALVYHSVDIPVEETQGKRVRHTICCIADKVWYSKENRNDCVWVQCSSHVKEYPLPYKALQGWLPCQLRLLFTLLLGGRQFYLAFIEISRPLAGGMPERVSQLVRVQKATGEGAYAVIKVSSITGAAHLVPEDPACLKQSSIWTVNSHIDLNTWNDVYYLTTSELEEQMKPLWG